MHFTAIRIVLGFLLATSGCMRREYDATGDSATAGQDDSSAVPVVSAAGCYRMATSVMGRERPLRGKSSTEPGWLRLDPGVVADSQRAMLIDADGAAMPGVWDGSRADSIRIRAFDDFLSVTIVALPSDSGLAGVGVATSDAELVRDSTGQLREMRREWIVAARAMGCDSMPPPAIPSGVIPAP